MTIIYIRDSVAGMKTMTPITCCVTESAGANSAEATAEAVALFKALGDATRLEIFRVIAAQHAEICVCHITDQFDVSQPTISHHLKVLREAGLITVSRRGVWAYYEVDRTGLERLQSLVGGFAPAVLAGAA